jgi:tetratricopeptide (TPR) repeat protein
MERGLNKDALDVLLIAERLDPKDVKHHFNLGEVYIRLGEKGRAQEELQTLKGIDASMANDLEKLINASAL